MMGSGGEEWGVSGLIIIRGHKRPVEPISKLFLKYNLERQEFKLITLLGWTMLLKNMLIIKCSSQYKAHDTCELLDKESPMSAKYPGYFHCLWLAIIMDKIPLLKTQHFGYGT